MATLAGKIAKASADLGNRLKADKRNTQGGGYMYISADKLIAEAGAVLAANGVAVFPSIVGYTVDGGESSGGKRNYIVTVNFMMAVTDGESSMDCPWMGAGVDYGAMDKALYKGITSGHKYFLAKLLNIGEGNEDGEHESTPTPQADRKEPPPQSTPPAAQKGATASQATANGGGAGNGNGNGHKSPEPDAFGNVQRPARWDSAAAAYAWAVECGACANEHEARGSLKKIVEARFGGRLTGDNMAAAFDAFHARQMEKLHVKADAATQGAPELDPNGEAVPA